MKPDIPLHEGRRSFGGDPAAYDAARPSYPEALYDRLVERCGLGPGTSVFEIGAGTGLATRRLLGLGANPLVAVEPDLRLASFLRENVPGVEVEETCFEEASLPRASFDIGIAATSFHWLEQSSALVKVKETLKPGGWWAMFWTNFGGEADAALREATAHLFEKTSNSPSNPKNGGLPFALDREARMRDLALAGFGNLESEVWNWTASLKTAELIQLYRTYSTVQVLDPVERERLLSGMAEIVERDFGGAIEQPFAVALYMAQCQI